jgi:hypothetical protein
MTTSNFLQNTDFTLNAGGYLDILRNRMALYVNNGAAVTALNALDTAIIAERNNVHTLLADGIVDVAVVSTAAAANDGGKLRWIAKNLIDTIEASVPFSTGVEVDQTAQWVATTTSVSSLANLTSPTKQPPTLFKSFVNPQSLTPYGYTANTRTMRATTIAAAYALYATVAAL